MAKNIIRKLPLWEASYAWERCFVLSFSDSTTATFLFSFSNATSHFAHRKTYPEVTNPFLALSVFVCLSIETITRPIWARRDILIRYFDRRRPIAFNGNLCAIMSRQLSDPLWDGNVTIIYKTEPLKRKCKSHKLRAIDGFCVSNETTWKWDFFIRLKEAKS